MSASCSVGELVVSELSRYLVNWHVYCLNCYYDVKYDLQTEITGTETRLICDKVS